jgi:hypothetical protein
MSNPTGRNQNPPEWPAAKTRKLKTLHAQGLSLNAIAREMGVAASTIHTHAKRLGLSFDRTQVEAANVARSVDAKARRQAAADRIYALFDQAASHAESVRTGAFKTTIRGKSGSEKKVELDFIPTTDQRQLAASVTQYVNAATKLESIDNDAGVAEAVSLLGRLARAVGLSDEVDPSGDDD